MANCPSCRRPVAVARPRCLYCGAELPRELVASVKGVDSPAAETSRSDRVLLILDARGTDAKSLKAALGIPAFEAGQRALRGGFQLLRVAAQDDADAERFMALGLRVVRLAESETQAAMRPHLASGGEWTQGTLHLRSDEGPIPIEKRGLLLVVRGPISREYQSEFKGKRVLGTLPPGYRIHLHLVKDVRPVELDPDAFDFGRVPVASSSLLQMNAWLENLGPDLLVEEAFGSLAPALGLSEGAPGGPFSSLSGTRRRAKGAEAPKILDNLGQFRFYSAWRGTLERQRAVR
jgi:hypothetical protein